ncbi:hypothetical protein D2962_10115 [Biomaibacter acetigenes]|uniref:Uncharacterized protein n=1 Tax=Biomaibacter acetigenes TaxID=2316383 RepID=A0A3G2R5T8_9FIRM|nr:hypothetical protein [Biomaibacter acetigenes]AYO30924.1 hypothetical protein D2962_10115 [Biomaibacter acetigenes]RKL61958.1 hypothetical protein DXT63_14020 [Thermoanaerobacteraceae bacterium SP2]
MSGKININIFQTSFNVSDKKGYFEQKGGGGLFGKLLDTAVDVGKRKLAGESAAFQVFNVTSGKDRSHGKVLGGPGSLLDGFGNRD